MQRKIKSLLNAVLICSFLAFALMSEVLPSTKAIVGVDATQAQSKATLSGVITDAIGTQIPDATISLYSADRVMRAKSDMKGKFQFSDVPSGAYQLETTRPGFKTMKIAAIQVTGKNEPLSIRLDVAAAGPCANMNSVSYVGMAGRKLYVGMAGRKLIGIVLASKQPVADAEVDLVSAFGTGVLATQRSNSKGEFIFNNLTPGQYLLMVSHSGYRDERTENFWIARENITKVEVDIIKNGLIRACQ